MKLSWRLLISRALLVLGIFTAIQVKSDCLFRYKYKKDFNTSSNIKCPLDSKYPSCPAGGYCTCTLWWHNNGLSTAQTGAIDATLMQGDKCANCGHLASDHTYTVPDFI